MWLAPYIRSLTTCPLETWLFSGIACIKEVDKTDHVHADKWITKQASEHPHVNVKAW